MGSRKRWENLTVKVSLHDVHQPTSRPSRGQQQSALAAQLQTALDSRAVIEQAKGVLIGQQGMSARAAYEQLRARARSQRRKLAAVSAEVVRDAASGG